MATLILSHFLLLAAFLVPIRLMQAAVIPACTQAALETALTNGGTITFTQACTITLSGTLAVARDTIIDAAGKAVTLNGNGTVRIFAVAPGVKLELRGVTLSAGSAVDGGAMHIGAGAAVTLTNCVVAGNKAPGANGVAGLDGKDSSGTGGNGKAGGHGTESRAGAIYNGGSLTVQWCRFATNSVTGGSGGNGGDGGDGGYQGGNGGLAGNGAGGWGGAIFNAGQLIITNTTFEGNTASGGSGGAGGAAGGGAFDGMPGIGGSGAEASGAAIYSLGGVSVYASTFSANRVTGGSSAAGGTLYSGNGSDGPPGAPGSGGAIFSAGGLTAVNSTFYDNTATGGKGGNGGPARFTAGKGGNGGAGTGGGIASSWDAYLLNCTLAQNAAIGGSNGVAGTAPFGNSDGRPGASRGGGLAQTGGSFWLKNTIVSGSTSGGNGYGSMGDLGQNISSDTSISLGYGSQAATDPVLGSLANNGGPTTTMAPLAGSPAIQRADPAAAPAVDQRGHARPGTGKLYPDIGAVEVLPAYIQTHPTNLVVTNGQSAAFYVVAGGDTPFRYSWRFNGAPIASATGSSYTVLSATTNQQGAYSVEVANALGATASSNAELRVAMAPVITTQPITQTVLTNSSARFVVLALGEIPMHYQWNFNAVPLPGQTIRVLAITNAAAVDQGNYAVVITNAYGSTTSAVAGLNVITSFSMTSPTMISNQLLVTVAARTGLTYVTEYKPSLTSTNWIPTATNLAVTPTLTLPLPNPSPSNAFYRIGVH